jgi:hypothetical protein
MPPRRRNARWRRRTLRWRPASTCPLVRQIWSKPFTGPCKGRHPANLRERLVARERETFTANAAEKCAAVTSPWCPLEFHRWPSTSVPAPLRRGRRSCAPCPAPPSACLCRQARSMGSTRCVRRQHTSEERLSRPVRYSHRLKQTEQRLSATSRADLQSRSLVPILLPSYRSCPEGDPTLHRLGRGLLRTTSFAAIQGEFVSPCHGDPDSANAAAGELT